MRKIISRPNPNRIPPLPLPIHLRSTGYNEAPPGWSENEARGEKNFVQLFWCVQGEGEFGFENRYERLRPGEVIYRLPGEQHQHRSADEHTPWHYYWFTFDGEKAADFMLSYGYPQRAIYAGECPIKLFRELEVLLRQRTLYAQRHAISVATELLALAGRAGAGPEHDLIFRFLDLIEARYPEPDLRVENLADELGVHRTTLTRMVGRQISVSPRQYLIQLRVQKALSLLTTSALTVKEIAEKVGIGKADVLCSLIRRDTGASPREYRRLASPDSL